MTSNTIHDRSTACDCMAGPGHPTRRHLLGGAAGMAMLPLAGAARATGADAAETDLAVVATPKRNRRR